MLINSKLFNYSSLKPWHFKPINTCRGQESWCKEGIVWCPHFCVLFRLTSCCCSQANQIFPFLALGVGQQKQRFWTMIKHFFCKLTPNIENKFQKHKEMIKYSQRKRIYTHTSSMYALSWCIVFSALPAAEPSSKLPWILDSTSLGILSFLLVWVTAWPLLRIPDTHYNPTFEQTYHWAQCWQCAERRSQTEDYGSSPAAAPPEVWMSPDVEEQRNTN